MAAARASAQEAAPALVMAGRSRPTHCLRKKLRSAVAPVYRGGPRGVEGPESAALLYSTVRGAGRVHGRKEAKRRFQRAEMDARLRGGVMLIGGGLDESPMAYRRLPDVLVVQANTIEVQNTLRRFAAVMPARMKPIRSRIEQRCLITARRCLITARRCLITARVLTVQRKIRSYLSDLS
jgi:tRNA-splicing ligase RtcB